TVDHAGLTHAAQSNAPRMPSRHARAIQDERTRIAACNAQRRSTRAENIDVSGLGLGRHFPDILLRNNWCLP
uniref:hypothetical protein n=1 Tax=Escherichia coli TaxID=562 RepID=UPI001964BB78